MLTDVSITKELRPGFVQTVYKSPSIRAIVLLFDVKQGAELPLHSHPESQFGYTFHGEYDFFIADRNIPATAGQSYLIAGRVPHSAVARQDYYSMDFKYKGKSSLDCPLALQVIQPALDCHGQPIGEVRFDAAFGEARVLQLACKTDYCLRPLLSKPPQERLLVASRETDVLINGKPVRVDTMKIYRLDAPEELNINIKETGAEVFLFEI